MIPVQPLLLSSSFTHTSTPLFILTLEGNIKAKWPSVCRKGIDSANRVVQLFTGYKGPRFCVEVLTHAHTPTTPPLLLILLNFFTSSTSTFLFLRFNISSLLLLPLLFLDRSNKK
jgi:hypothetical protein